MKQRNFIRLLAVLLAVILLALPVSANSGQRLAVEREVYAFLTEELKLTTAAAQAAAQARAASRCLRRTGKHRA